MARGVEILEFPWKRVEEETGRRKGEEKRLRDVVILKLVHNVGLGDLAEDYDRSGISHVPKGAWFILVQTGVLHLKKWMFGVLIVMEFHHYFLTFFSQ